MPLVDQPEAILGDFKKAKRMWDDPNRSADRFGDDVDNIKFWINMSTILHDELRRALNASR